MTTLDPTLLRPLRLGEILDRSIRLYRKNFWHFIGVVAVVQIPITLMQFLAYFLTNRGTSQMFQFDPTAPPTENPFALLGADYAAGASLSMLSSLLTIILVQGIATAVLTRVVAESYFGYPAGNVLDAYRRSKDSWLPMLMSMLVLFIIGVAVFIWWLVVPCVGWLTGGGMLVFLGWVIYPLTAPAVVLEKQPITNAWQRAWNLARHRFWWLLGFAFILYLFNVLVIGSPAAILGAISQLGTLQDPFATPSTLALLGQSLLQALIILLGSLLYLPLQVCCFTLIYLDLRVRTEGLDLALQTSEMKMDASPAVSEEMDEVIMPSAKEQAAGRSSLLQQLAATAPALSTWRSEQLMTGREMGTFALMTMGFFGIVLAFYALIFALVALLLF